MTESSAEYCKAILGEAREELERADNKASILLAAVGVIVGALLAALLAGDWSPTSLKASVQWLWWAGILAAAIAIYLLGWAVFPRIRAAGWRPQAIAYYGDVVAAGTRNRVKELLDHASGDPLPRLIDQMLQVSKTVQVKYVAIRRAMILLGFGAAACASAFLIHHLA